MNRRPAFSVVIPAFNAEHCLGACLEALEHQTAATETVEVIVIDDGSTDATATVAKDHGVRVVTQENQGPAAARNHGAGIASGDIILFTDSDCVPDRDWIRQMTAPFSDPAVSGVKGAYRTRQPELTARFAQAEFEDRFERLKKAETIDMVDTYSAAFRRQVFLDQGGFDTSFPVANNEDTEFSYRLVSQGHRLVFNPRAFVFHTHPASLRTYLRVKFWRGYWRIIVYARYPDKAVSDTYTPAVIKIQSLVMAVLLALCPLALFRAAAALAAAAAALVILATALPFSAAVFRKDITLGLVSPGYVFLRALVFALGSLFAVFSLILGKTRVRDRR